MAVWKVLADDSAVTPHSCFRKMMLTETWRGHVTREMMLVLKWM